MTIKKCDRCGVECDAHWEMRIPSGIGKNAIKGYEFIMRDFCRGCMASLVMWFNYKE